MNPLYSKKHALSISIWSIGLTTAVPSTHYNITTHVYYRSQGRCSRPRSNGRAPPKAAAPGLRAALASPTTSQRLPSRSNSPGGSGKTPRLTRDLRSKFGIAPVGFVFAAVDIPISCTFGEDRYSLARLGIQVESVHFFHPCAIR